MTEDREIVLWDISKDSDENMDLIARNFLVVKRNLIERSIQRGNIKNIRLEVHFSVDDEANALATKDDEGKYYIIINKGLLIDLQMRIGLVSTKVTHEFPILARINSGIIPVRSADMALSHVFWHEFAHIIRGHVDYLDAANLLRSINQRCKGISEVSHKGKSTEDDLSTDQKNLRYFIETDADQHASRSIASDVVSMFEQFSEGLTLTDKELTLYEVVKLTSFSVQSLYWSFEIATATDDLDYPYPLVRSAYSLTAFMNGMELITEIISKKYNIKADLSKIKIAVREGYELSNLLSGDIYKGNITYNPYVKAQEWLRIAPEELALLQKELSNYLLVNKGGSDNGS